MLDDAEMAFKARHIWVFHKIDTYLNIGGFELVESAFRPSAEGHRKRNQKEKLSSSNYHTLSRFFGKGGPRTVFAYCCRKQSESSAAVLKKTARIDKVRKLTAKKKEPFVPANHTIVLSSSVPPVSLRTDHGVLYLIRKSTEIDLNPMMGDDGEIQCGMVHKPALQTFETALTAVFHPMFTLEKKWGSCELSFANKFRHNVLDFMGILQNALKTLSGGLQLRNPRDVLGDPNESGALLKRPSSSFSPSSLHAGTLEIKKRARLTSEYPDALSRKCQSRRDMQRCLELVEEWIGDVKAFLKTSDTESQAWQTTYAGPDTEIDFWKRRFYRLQRVQDQLQSVASKEIIRRLSATSSGTVRQKLLSRSRGHGGEAGRRGSRRGGDCKKEIALKNNDSDDDGGGALIATRKAVNEAKDISKHLSSLKPFVQSMHEKATSDLVPIMRPLMESLSRIHTTSSYYSASSSERIETLLQKFTNLLIVHCKKTINDDDDSSRLWDKPPELLADRLEACLRLYESYQDAYRHARDELLTKPRERQFDFREILIFGRFDNFCRRMVSLMDLFSTAHQFRDLKDGGGTEIMRNLGVRFDAALCRFRKLSHDMLDFESSGSKVFAKDFDTFQSDVVVPLERELMQSVGTVFDNHVTSITESLSLLRRLEKVLRRDDFRKELKHRLRKIFSRYANDLRVVEAHYEEVKDSPPICRNVPPVTGHILWIRNMIDRVREPMAVFQDMAPQLLREHDAKKVVRRYNKVLKVLLSYEFLWFEGWTRTIDSARDAIRATLLVRAATTDTVDETRDVLDDDDINRVGRIAINLDPRILRLVRETESMERLGLNVPLQAKKVLTQGRKFKHCRDNLVFILEEFDRVHKMIVPALRPLLKGHLAHVRECIRPFFVELTWSSVSIENFKQSVMCALKWLDGVLTMCNTIYSDRIIHDLGRVRRTSLFQDSTENAMSLDEFLDVQNALVRRGKDVFCKRSRQIELAIDELIRFVLQTRSPKDEVVTHKIDPAVQTREYFERMMYEALVGSVKKSVRSLKDRMCDRMAGSGFLALKLPFFSIDVQLVVPYVRLNPSLDAVQKSVNRAARAMIECTKEASKWSNSVTRVEACATRETSSSKRIPMPPVQDIASTENTNNKKEGGSSKVSRRSNYYDAIASDRAIVRICLSLTGGIKSLRNRVENFLHSFDKYSWLWTDNIQEAHETFVRTLSQNADGEYDLNQQEVKLKEFLDLEAEIKKIAVARIVGSLSLNLQNLKLQLRGICRSWRVQYSSLISKRASKRLGKFLDFVDISMGTFATGMQSVRTVDDLRDMLQLIKRVRDRGSTIHSEIHPIQDLFRMLRIYQPSGHVDAAEMKAQAELFVTWRNLEKIAKDIQEQLAGPANKFRRQLLADKKGFDVDILATRSNFELEGPMRPGLEAFEASAKLDFFRKRFADLNKRRARLDFVGDIFDIAPGEYGSLDACNETLRLLGILYDIYNAVRKALSEFKSLAWTEVAARLMPLRVSMATFKRRAQSLGPEVKSWPAFKELWLNIIGFEAAYPVLNVLSDARVVKPRHWGLVNENILGGLMSGVDVTQSFKAVDVLGSSPSCFSLPAAMWSDDDPELRAANRGVAEETKARKEVSGTIGVDDGLDEQADALDINLSGAQRLMVERGAVLGICKMANREAAVESKIMELKHAWTVCEFEFGKWGSEFMPIVLNWENISGSLEDAVMTLQIMLPKRQASPFRESIATQLDQLSNTLKSVSSWERVQALWMSLDFAYADEEIIQSLPVAVKTFRKLCRTWSRVMRHAKSSKNVVKCCVDESVVSAIRMVEEELERCKVHLRKYVEAKRAEFPRFYLVSDAMLLRILSRGAKDASHLRRYYPIIFCDAISDVEWDAEKRFIMNVKASTQSSLDTTLALKDPVRCDGIHSSVEIWMRELHKSLCATVRMRVEDAVCEALEDSIRCPSFHKIADRAIPQVRIVALQALWTSKTEKSMSLFANGDRDAFHRLKHRYRSFLTSLVRSQREARKKGNRLKLATLALSVQHHASVLNLLLNEENSPSVSSFEWTRHLRFYWSQERHGEISIGPRQIRYNNDLLSAEQGSMTAITPLAEKCILSIALGVSQNGLTGLHVVGAGHKVSVFGETLRFLGSLCAVQVAEFPGCRTFSFRDLSRIVNGLYNSNMWGCLDGLLSMSRPAISSFASLIRQNSLKCTNRLSSIFITNRCRLPEVALPTCLKLAFRAHAALKLNSEFVLRATLRALGFEDFVKLAKKCSQLLSDMSRCQFLAGVVSDGASLIRALVLACVEDENMMLSKTLGRPQREHAFVADILLRDLEPRVKTAQEMRIFRKAVADIFVVPLSGDNDSKTNDDDVHIKTALATVLKSRGLQVPETFLARLRDLHRILSIGHAVVVLGSSHSGKTTAIRAVREATDLLAEQDLLRSSIVGGVKKVNKFLLHGTNLENDDDLREDQDDEPDIRECRLFPSSMTTRELYGSWDDSEKRWINGVFGSLWEMFNDPSREDRGRSEWFVCDGNLDASWLSHFYPALQTTPLAREDERLPQLDLPNGHHIFLAEGNKIIVESSDVDNVHPGLLGSVAVLCFEETTIGWDVILESFFCKSSVRSLLDPFDGDDGGKSGRDDVARLQYKDPDKREASITYRVRVLREIFHSFLSFSKEDDRIGLFAFVSSLPSFYLSAMQNVETSLIRSTLLLLTEVLERVDLSASDVDVTDELERAVLWSMTWSVGSMLNEGDRKKFDEYLGELAPKNVPSIGKRRSTKGSSELSVFDFYIDSETLEWEPVNVALWNAPERRTFQHSTNLFVPTRESTRLFLSLDHLMNRRSLFDIASNREDASRTFVSLVGPAESGKSATWRAFFDMNADRSSSNSGDEDDVNVDIESKFSIRRIYATRASSTAQIRNVIESELVHRGGRTIGPRRNCEALFFVEDMSLLLDDSVHDEERGCSISPRDKESSPAELLRQLVGNQSISSMHLKSRGTTWQLRDVFWASSHRPFTKYNARVLERSSRLLRHFVHIGTAPSVESQAKTIFEQQFCWWFKTRTGEKSSFANVAVRLIDPTLELWNHLRSYIKTESMCSVTTRLTFSWNDIQSVLRYVMRVGTHALVTAKSSVRKRQTMSTSETLHAARKSVSSMRRPSKLASERLQALSSISKPQASKAELLRLWRRACVHTFRRKNVANTSRFEDELYDTIDRVTSGAFGRREEENEKRLSITSKVDERGAKKKRGWKMSSKFLASDNLRAQLLPLWTYARNNDDDDANDAGEHDASESFSRYFRYKRCASEGKIREHVEKAVQQVSSLKSSSLFSLVSIDEIVGSSLDVVSALGHSIQLDENHALVLGPRGSGKRTIAKVAAKMIEFDFVSLRLEMNRKKNVELTEDTSTAASLLALFGKENSTTSFESSRCIDAFAAVCRRASFGKKILVLHIGDEDIRCGGQVFLDVLEAFMHCGELPLKLTSLESRESLSSEMRQRLCATCTDEVSTKVPKCSSRLFEMFCEGARRRLRIVCTISTESRAHEMYRSRLRPLYGCRRVRVGHWIASSFERIAIEWSVNRPGLREAIVNVSSKDGVASNRPFSVFAQIHAVATRDFGDTLQKSSDFACLYEEWVYLLKLWENRLKTKHNLMQSSIDQASLAMQALAQKKSGLGKMTKQYEAETKGTSVGMELMQEKAMLTRVREGKLESTKIKLAQTRALIDEEEEKVKADLEEATPHVLSAQHAIESIQAKEIQKTRKMPNPNDMTKLVFDCVLLLLGEPIKSVEPIEVTLGFGMDRTKETFIADSYLLARRGVLAEKTFLRRLFLFVEENRDHVNDETLELLEPYFDLPHFVPEKLRQISPLSSRLLAWAKAAVEYRNASRDVQPQVEAVQHRKNELAHDLKTMGVLESQCRALRSDLGIMQSEFGEQMRKRVAIKSACENLRQDIKELEELVLLLKARKISWEREGERLEAMGTTIVGECILAAAIVAYGGSLTPDNRQLFMRKVESVLRESGVAIDSTSLSTSRRVQCVLFRAVEKEYGVVETRHLGREWEVQGLTSPFALESALIALKQRSRTPLLIDRDGRGLIWLRSFFRGTTKDAPPHVSIYDEMSVVETPSTILEQRVKDAMQRGSTVVLTDVDDDAFFTDNGKSPVVVSLMNSLIECRLTRHAGVILFRRSDTNLWDYNAKFRVFLVCDHMLSCSRIKPHERVTFVNFATSRSGLVSLFLKMTTKRVDETLFNTLESRKREIRLLEEKIVAGDSKMLEALAVTDGHAEGAHTSKSTKGEGSFDRKYASSLIKLIMRCDEYASTLKDARSELSTVERKRDELLPTAQRATDIFEVAMSLSENGLTLRKFADAFGRAVDVAVLEKLAQDQVIRKAQIECLHAENEDNRHAVASFQNKSSSSGKMTRDVTCHLLQFCARHQTRLHRSIFETAIALQSDLRSGKIHRRDLQILLFETGKEKEVAQYASLNSIDESQSPVKWLTAETWSSIQALEKQTPSCRGITKHVVSQSDLWEAFVKNSQPEKRSLPSPYGGDTPHHRLLRIIILRALRPDRVVFALKHMRLGANLDFAAKKVPQRRGPWWSSILRGPVANTLECGDDDGNSHETKLEDDDESSVDRSKDKTSRDHSRVISYLTVIISEDASSCEDPFASIASVARRMGVESTTLLYVNNVDTSARDAYRAWSRDRTRNSNAQWLCLRNAHINGALLREIESNELQFVKRTAKSSNISRHHLWIHVSGTNSRHLSRRLLRATRVVVFPARGPRVPGCLLETFKDRLLSILRSDIVLSYVTENASFLKTQKDRRLVLAMAVLHAAIHERSKCEFFGWESLVSNSEDLRQMLQSIATVNEDKDQLAALVCNVVLSSASSRDRSVLNEWIRHWLLRVKLNIIPDDASVPFRFNCFGDRSRDQYDFPSKAATRARAKRFGSTSASAFVEDFDDHVVASWGISEDGLSNGVVDTKIVGISESVSMQLNKRAGKQFLEGLSDTFATTHLLPRPGTENKNVAESDLSVSFQEVLDDVRVHVEDLLTVYSKTIDLSAWDTIMRSPTITCVMSNGPSSSSSTPLCDALVLSFVEEAKQFRSQMAMVKKDLSDALQATTSPSTCSRQILRVIRSLFKRKVPLSWLSVDTTGVALNTTEDVATTRKRRTPSVLVDWMDIATRRKEQLEKWGKMLIHRVKKTPDGKVLDWMDTVRIPRVLNLAHLSSPARLLHALRHAVFCAECMLRDPSSDKPAMALDDIVVRCDVTKYYDANDQAKESRDSKRFFFFVEGARLVGASWEDQIGCLAECSPHRTTCPLPFLKVSISTNVKPREVFDPAARANVNASIALREDRHKSRLLTALMPSTLLPAHWIVRGVFASTGSLPS
eukprot:g535.t1